MLGVHSIALLLLDYRTQTNLVDDFAFPDRTFGQPSRQPNSRVRLTDAQKSFIENAAPKNHLGFVICPSKDFIQEIESRGRAEGVFTSSTTYEGIRSYLRSLQNASRDVD